ncbi:hypothetical protein [Alicyclobacillus fastidiosus]|uniref:Uncharacterized protein n=1 Tax=Alicyclobacillus fastidiosus TaxID=392011 RepID=A0ABV5AFK2_9BACL|nr:hypothetical protein [Alicyclobacillus fastidiosus]WEH09576.1 hypothetical protein PYS47_23550 [Alicyclobacillus fastidiosus]
MKRTLTGIAAAAVVLGTLSPMAFAATAKATAPTNAGQTTFALNGTLHLGWY